MASYSIVEMEYLYFDSQYWHFMKTDGSYDQVATNQSAVADCGPWLKATDPGLKGDTASGGTKPATLSTGAVVKVPLFINIGEVIRVDTRTE